MAILERGARGRGRRSSRERASVSPHLLTPDTARLIKDRRLLNLMGQYLRRCAERGGLYWSYPIGISLGCPLSPIMGAFFLREVDAELEKHGLFFVRYMDDILVLAPTRWKLKSAVKGVNRALALLQLDKHPEKTFIGRIERGFDFLGYHFTRAGLTLALSLVEHFVERGRRLYEQESGKRTETRFPDFPRSQVWRPWKRNNCLSLCQRLGDYARRWAKWAEDGARRRRAQSSVSDIRRRRSLTLALSHVGRRSRRRGSVRDEAPSRCSADVTAEGVPSRGASKHRVVLLSKSRAGGGRGTTGYDNDDDSDRLPFDDGYSHKE